MVKINLLPWREELRQQKQQDFIAAIGAGVGVTLILFGLVYWHIEEMKKLSRTAQCYARCADSIGQYKN
jgi:Fimbrial assembly protein (PilN).